MTRVSDRLRSRRLGIVAVVLLVLLVLVVAHGLIMGARHDGEPMCGSCVVVIATGLAAIVALRSATRTPVLGVFRLAVAPVALVPFRPLRSPPLQTTVLRL